jgi:hypothetical protein
LKPSAASDGETIVIELVGGGDAAAIVFDGDGAAGGNCVAPGGGAT